MFNFLILRYFNMFLIFFFAYSMDRGSKEAEAEPKSTSLIGSNAQLSKKLSESWYSHDFSENLSSFLSDISSLNLPIHISSRFMLSLVLQNSDINLRARIIQY